MAHHRFNETERRRQANEGRYLGREGDANMGYGYLDPYAYGGPGREALPYNAPVYDDEDLYAQKNFGRRYGPPGVGPLAYGVGMAPMFPAALPHPQYDYVAGQYGAPTPASPYHPHPHQRGFFDKAGDEVQSWLGNEEAQERREEDRHEGEHRGRGPKGYSRSDDRIREDACDRLADDSWLDPSEIDVTAENGEVTLDGYVRSRSDKRRAEDLVDSVSGVQHVQNNLRVNADHFRQREAPSSVPHVGNS